MKNKIFCLTAVFFVAFCVSAFAGGKKESSSQRYLFEQNFVKNDISEVTIEEYGQSYSYIPNIGFSVGKRVVYNGSIALLDNIIPDSALAVLNKDELRLLRNTIYAKYGMIFQSDDLKTHFQQFNWYKPNNNNVDRRLSDTDKTNIKNIQIFENAEPNHDIINKKDIILDGFEYFPVPDWTPEIHIKNDNTIEYKGWGEDNFRGNYKIENGFLVVLVTEQNVGTAKYFLNNNWNWSNGATYSKGIVKYKEPIKMVFPIGDITIFEYQDEFSNEFIQKLQIGTVSWVSPVDFELIQGLAQKLDTLMQKRAAELSKARYKNADIEKITCIDTRGYINNGTIIRAVNTYRVSMRGNIIGLIGRDVDVIVTGDINYRNKNIQVLEANIK